MAISITQIAKKAGVSIATVSRIINRSGSVAPKTLQLVEDTLQTYGLKLADLRKNVVSKQPKFGVIAFLQLSHDVFQPFSSVRQRSIDGVINEAQAKNYNVIIANISTIDDLPSLVINRKIDGLILAGHTPNANILEALTDIPATWITSHNNNGGAVLTGNDLISKMAVNYLHERGHKKIAFLNAISKINAIKAREEYFHFFAGRLNLASETFDSDQIFLTNNAKELDFDKLEDLLDRVIQKYLNSPNRATGIFVPMDFQISLVYKILQKYNVRIGHDVELIGCDGELMTIAGLYPRPATIAIHGEDIGRYAVEQLLLMIDDNSNNRKDCEVIIKPHLILGEEVK